MTPDVNVLVAASRHDHVHHAAAAAWIASALKSSDQELLLFPVVLASYVRLAIHPRVFPTPTPLPTVFAFIDAMLGMPNTRIPAMEMDWRGMRQACLDRAARSNDIPDIWLASAVRQHGDHLVTFDAGFRRLLGRSELTVLS